MMILYLIFDYFSVCLFIYSDASVTISNFQYFWRLLFKWIVPCIDAHGGGGQEEEEGAPHVPPQKTLKNCNIKMQ
jgi:hypothetical protein